MARALIAVVAVASLGLFVRAAGAEDVTLDNQLTGTDQFSVVLDEDGYSREAYIQAPGEDVEDLMYEYIPILDLNSVSSYFTGGVWDDNDPSDGSVTSHGVEPGDSFLAAVRDDVAPLPILSAAVAIDAMRRPFPHLSRLVDLSFWRTLP